MTTETATGATLPGPAAPPPARSPSSSTSRCPLTEFADDYDVEAISEDFWEAPIAEVPEDVSLNGTEVFYGPYYDGSVLGIEWAIVEKHEWLRR